MKQEVTEYEADMISKGAQVDSNTHLYDPHEMRYSNWQLQETLELVLSHHDHSLKWIGNDPNANVLAFFYCVLSGCLRDDSGADSLFIKLKYNLYQEAKETLAINEQKTFVEHIRLAQHSKNIGEFLKKSRYLESTLIKIFSARKAQLLSTHLKGLSTLSTKIQELQLYSSSFPFFGFQVLNEKCGKVTIKDQVYFIIEEKECFFIAEDRRDSIISSSMSRVSNYTKRIKTEVIESTIPQKQSKIYDTKNTNKDSLTNKELNRNNSATVPSFLGRLKKSSRKEVDLSQSEKQSQSKQIKKVDLDRKNEKKSNPSDVLNSIEEIQQNVESFERQIKKKRLRSLQKVKESSSFKLLESKNGFYGGMRTSLGQDVKPNFSYFQAIASSKQPLRERLASTSLQKDRKTTSKHKRVIEKQVMAKSKDQITDRESVPKEDSIQHSIQQRSNYIYQSLGPQNSRQQIILPINAPFIDSDKKAPKFLQNKGIEGKINHFTDSGKNQINQKSLTPAFKDPSSLKQVQDSISPRRQLPKDQSGLLGVSKIRGKLPERKPFGGYWSPKQLKGGNSRQYNGKYQ